MIAELLKNALVLLKGHLPFWLVLSSTLRFAGLCRLNLVYISLSVVLSFGQGHSFF